MSKQSKGPSDSPFKYKEHFMFNQCRNYYKYICIYVLTAYVSQESRVGFELICLSNAPGKPLKFSMSSSPCEEAGARSSSKKDFRAGKMWESRKNVGEQWGRTFRKPLPHCFKWAATGANEAQVGVPQRASGLPGQRHPSNAKEGSCEPPEKVPL